MQQGLAHSLGSIHFPRLAQQCHGDRTLAVMEKHAAVHVPAICAQRLIGSWSLIRLVLAKVSAEPVLSGRGRACRQNAVYVRQM